MVKCKSNTRFSSIKNSSKGTTKVVHPDNSSGSASISGRATSRNANTWHSPLRVAPVILTQTDTTVGFVSQNHQRLADIKSRPNTKPFIIVYKEFRDRIPGSSPRMTEVRHLELDNSRQSQLENTRHSQLENTRHSQLDWESRPRIPNRFKNLVRRAKKTSFVVKNQAFRIDKDYKHSQILRNIHWHYSTSANEANKKFNREFCEDKTDIIIEDKKGLNESLSSRLLKINNIKIKALR